MSTRLSPLVLAVALLDGSAPAMAQAWGSINMSLPMMNSAFAVNSYSMAPFLTPRTDDKGGPVSSQGRIAFASPPVANRVSRGPASESATPPRLASSYPATQRPAAEKQFRQLLAGYDQIAAKLGIPADDLAGAVAAYIAGAYMAYNNTDFPDANFKPLVDQIRRALAEGQFAHVSDAAQGTAALEEFAILGTMCAATRAAITQDPSNPGAADAVARNRAAGESYLRTLLKVDPSRVRITDRGLAY